MYCLVNTTSDRGGMGQRGRAYRFGDVQRKMPVRQIFGRQRLFAFRVFSLFFDFQIPQHRDQHDEHDAAQTAADNETQPSRQYRDFIVLIRIVRHVAFQSLHFGAPTTLCVA